MSAANDLAALFRRDLTRLVQELEQFPDDGTLWRTLPGVTNSAGNLALHLEGNLREYVGRQLGQLAYVRSRDDEFAATGQAVVTCVKSCQALVDSIPAVIGALSPASLDADYPEEIRGQHLSTRQFLMHLYGHLNYHLGQIDYLRRILTAGTAINLVNL